MDRFRPSAPQRSTAVRTARSAALDLLLRAPAGERGELAPDAKAGPVVHEAPVFRQPQDGRRVRRGSPSCPATDAHLGNRSALPQAVSESPGSRPPDLSIPAARRCYSASPKSGTPIIVRSSPQPTSWLRSKSVASRSAWMAAGAPSTMFLSNGCGARSSTS